VTEIGDRRVWAEVEQAHDDWQALARPGRRRYRLDVTPERQTITLTGADGPVVEWKLPA
jgi:hypothetical protein